MVVSVVKGFIKPAFKNYFDKFSSIKKKVVPMEDNGDLERFRSEPKK